MVLGQRCKRLEIGSPSMYLQRFRVTNKEDN